MLSIEEVLEQLKAKGRPDQLEGMSRFGIVGEKRLGVSIPDLRRLPAGLPRMPSVNWKAKPCRRGYKKRI